MAGNSNLNILDYTTIFHQGWYQDVNDGVEYILGLNTMNRRYPFALGLNYAINDYTIYNGGFYLCYATVTNAALTPDADPSHWQLLSISTSLSPSSLLKTYETIVAGATVFNLPFAFMGTYAALYLDGARQGSASFSLVNTGPSSSTLTLIGLNPALYTYLTLDCFHL